MTSAYTSKIRRLPCAELEAEHARLELDHSEFEYAPPDAGYHSRSHRDGPL